MEYTEALKIGSKVDGYIKCTYAELLGIDSGKLFSLQRSALSVNVAKEELEQNIGEVDNPNADLSLFTQYDMPIVRAVSRFNSKMVDVKLSSFAKDYILTHLARLDKISPKRVPNRWNVWIIVDKAYQDVRRDFVQYKYYDKFGTYLPANIEYLPGGKILYHDNSELEPKISAYPKIDSWGHYKIEVTGYGYAPNDRYEELRQAVKNNETFMVKECAIDWVPADANNAVVIGADGKEIKLTDALEAARKKLERAKALLTAATTITII